MAYARFLPETLPPPAQRLIEEYAFQPGDPPILVGGYVRIQLLGQLHDAYVIGEEEEHLHMRTKCGVDVRQSREDVGGMRWPVDPDTNPPSLNALMPEWFLLATERPRTQQVGSIDIHLPPPSMKQEGVRLPPSSTHRRVRLFSIQEDRRNPSRAPNFVYLKLYQPYLLLRPLPIQRPSSARPRSAASRLMNGTQLQQDMMCGYMREAAAHSILHLCPLQIAPKSFYSHINETTGSYAHVMEDSMNTLPWEPWIDRPSQAKTDKEEADYLARHKEKVKTLSKLFEGVAVLHGRFMRNHSGSVPVAKHLLQAMVHPKLFYATWRDALDNERVDSDDEDGGDMPELLRSLAEIYGVEVPPPSSAPATVPAGTVEPVAAAAAPRTEADDVDKNVEVVQEEQSKDPNENSTIAASSQAPASKRQSTATEKRNQLAYPSSFPIGDLAPSTCATSTSLSLIHGRLHEPTHILRHADRRGVPQTLFLDWKYCGIGPVEVDLLQLLMLVPASLRRKDPDLMNYCLSEYLLTIKIFYPEVEQRTLPDLLCRMRTVALLCLGSDPFDWNAQGNVTSKYVQLHHELCAKTTRQQLKILQKKLESGDPLYTW